MSGRREVFELVELWDAYAIRATPLRTSILSEETSGRGAGKVVRREAWFHSHDWSGGEVRIAAHLAFPAAREPVPAVIMGTGDVEAGEDFCRRHQVATILIDRPGTGESTGPEDVYENWVTFRDPRESWMWHYVNSALRAVTLATTLPEVDPQRIGITGSSRGGTMAWIANAVDARIKLSIPVATGGDIVRALDQGGWASYLYRDAEGKPGMPPAFYEFARYYDPLAYCGLQRGGVLLIVGAQDEFFPIHCTGTTAEAALAGGNFRLLLVANWDHGYFAGDNPQVEAFDNTKEASAKRHRTIEAAIHHWLRGGEPLPKMPELTAKLSEARLHVRVTVDGSEPVRVVRLYASTDEAYSFRAVPTRRQEEAFVARLRIDDDPQSLKRVALFAEVEYTGGAFLTSLPWLGPDFRQRMRPFPDTSAA